MKRLLPAILLLCAAAPVAARGPRDEAKWVERTLRSMTLEQKIGQMLMARSPMGAFRAIDAEELRSVRRAIVEFHAGGVHAGIGDAAAVAVSLNEFQNLARIPLLTTSNFEGGGGYVLYGSTRMPRAMAIAATGDERLAYEAARVTAQEGRALGVNVNFYPVADVNNNPANPIINIRSFGEDPATVARFTAAYVRGLQEHGQLATAKHFPGHGDVATDSHLQMPVLDVTRERLQAVELPPFRAAIDAGVAAVMTAHIWLPRLEPEKDLPATLSKAIVTDLLRGELGFQGLVFTDSMSMRGITASFAPEEATLRAVEAGADLLVNLPDLETSFRAIQTAVKSGRIAEERITASVRRILEAKARLGLMDRENRGPDLDRLMQKVGTTGNRAVAQRIADRAITLVRDERKVLPLKQDRDARVVQIHVLDRRDGWREGPVGRVMASELAKRLPRTVTVTIDDQSTPADFESARKLAREAGVLVVNGFVAATSYKGSIDFTADQLALLRELAAMDKPLVFHAFGSPYPLLRVPELPAYVATYEITPSAELAAVRAMTGEIPYQGRLPVSLPGLYAIGWRSP